MQIEVVGEFWETSKMIVSPRRNARFWFYAPESGFFRLWNHINQNPIGTATSNISHDTPLIKKTPRPDKGRVPSCIFIYAWGNGWVTSWCGCNGGLMAVIGVSYLRGAFSRCLQHLKRFGNPCAIFKGQGVSSRAMFQSSYWVNYNELTTSSLEIIVSKGNHPQMALIQG